MQRSKIQNLQFQVAKVDLNMLIYNQESSFTSTNRQKKRNNQQATCKRLKYCYQRRFLHLDIKNQIYNRNSQKFNDTNHFYQSNGTHLDQTNKYATTNLLFEDPSLSKIDNSTITTQDLKKKSTSQRNKTTSSPSRTKIVNLSLTSSNQVKNQFKKIFVNSDRSGGTKCNWSRSKSSIQNGNTARQGFKIINQKQIRQDKKNMKTKHINPYTKEEYLYFRRKQKEQIKKKMQEIKKKQLQFNILKPCQIYQKQLNIREHNNIQITDLPIRPYSTKSNRKLYASTPSPKKGSLNKTLILNFKQQECIKPWESYGSEQFLM